MKPFTLPVASSINAPVFRVVETCVAQSDGSACPRGWYVLIQANDHPTIGLGPHITPDDAIETQKRFLNSIDASNTAHKKEQRFHAAQVPGEKG